MKIDTEIKRWGNSLALRISGQMAEIPHFQEGMKVTVEVTPTSLNITPAENTRLLELIEGSPKEHMVLTDEDREWLSIPSVGKEV